MGMPIEKLTLAISEQAMLTTLAIDATIPMTEVFAGIDAA